MVKSSRSADVCIVFWLDENEMLFRERRMKLKTGRINSGYGFMQFMGIIIYSNGYAVVAPFPFYQIHLELVYKAE